MRYLLFIALFCSWLVASSVHASALPISHDLTEVTTLRQRRKLRDFLKKLFDDAVEFASDPKNRKRARELLEELLDVDLFPPSDVPKADTNEGKGAPPEDPDNPDNPFGIDPPQGGPPSDKPSNRGRGNPPEDRDNPDNPFGIDPPPGPVPDRGGRDSNEGRGRQAEDRDNPDNPFGIDPPSPPRDRDGGSSDNGNSGGNDRGGDRGGCCGANDLPDSF